MVLLVVVYLVFVAIEFALVAATYPSLQGVDIVILSAVGLLVAITAIWFGIIKASHEDLSGIRIVTYPAPYEMDGKRFAVSIINSGASILIREVVLIIGKLRSKHSWRLFLSGAPPFEMEMASSSFVLMGAFPFDSGRVVRIPEEALSGALGFFLAQGSDLREQVKREKYDIYLLVFDSHSSTKTLSEGWFPFIVSGCELGSAEDLLNATEKKTKLPINWEHVMQMGPDVGGGRHPVQMVQGNPPNITWDEAVMKKLESIEELLKKRKGTPSSE